MRLGHEVFARIVASQLEADSDFLDAMLTWLSSIASMRPSEATCHSEQNDMLY